MKNTEEYTIDENIKNNKKYIDNNQLIFLLEKQLNDCTQKILEKKKLHEKEMMNLLNRLNKDVENARKFSLEKLLIDFLPIADSIDYALNAIKNSDSDEIFIEIINQLKRVSDIFKESLMYFNVTKIDNIHVSFDPCIHQAMSIHYTNDIKPNQIVNIMQVGYILYQSRLLRPAMVVVSHKKT